MIIRDAYIEKFDTLIDDRVANILSMIKTKKQRFRVSRVPEDMRNVPVFLDIPYENLYIRDSFEWNLNDWNISPREFITQLCSQLKINDQDRLYKQLVFQLMDYIERHQFQDHQVQNDSKKPNITTKKKQLQQPKPTARQQRIQQRVMNKKCNNCESNNNSPGVDCRKCLIPFHISDVLNKADPIKDACVAFFEVVARTKINYIMSKEFKEEDFCSLYVLKDKLLKQAHNTQEEKGVELAFQELMKLKNVAQYKLSQLPDQLNENNNQEKQEESEEEEEEVVQQERIQLEEQQEEEVKSDQEDKEKIEQDQQDQEEEVEEKVEEEQDLQEDEQEEEEEEEGEEEEEEEEEDEVEEEEKRPSGRKSKKPVVSKVRRSARAIEKRLKKQKHSLRLKYRS